LRSWRAVSEPEDEVMQTRTLKGNVQVGPVSSIWLSRLVEIDASWNPKSWSERLFAQELNNPAARVRGVFVAEELVGYSITHVVMDEAHLVSLGVAPEHRGLGLGQMLVRDLRRIAHVENIRVITLQVRVSNQIAQRLYRAFGFQVAGVRKHYYSDNGEDGITMRYEVHCNA
jgi:ribosomal-protein-alanine N-acetyltransferase